jgi:hypothetical protein
MIREVTAKQTCPSTAWRVAGVVFASVVAAQLWLVAACGTDIPWGDAWDVEGQRLYPAARTGTWAVADFFVAHNEHRIFWTKVLGVGLFSANGQWDPLVQLVAGAVLRALAVAGLAGMLVRATKVRGRAAAVVAAGVAFAFLPHLAWHNALWGFQSQVYFSLGFSVLALGWLGVEGVAGWRRWAGVAAGVAGLFAMGGAALVPVALIGLVALRALERRAWTRERWRELWPALGLLAAAVMLRVEVPEHAALQAQSAGQWLETFLRALAWPHAWQPLAAFGLNAPLAWTVLRRVLGGRRATAGEDFVVVLGGWAVAMAAAMAWSRGASGEFFGAIPSRYVDFLVLLPLANAWCVAMWVRTAGTNAVWGEETDPGGREATGQGRRQGGRVAGLIALGWGAFLAVGWAGLTAETLRGIIVPRMADREAPVRLAVAFQRSGDATVLAGQPRLLVPHPNPDSVRVVLADERMRGALPPSLQPDQPMGPLSRAARWVLWRDREGPNSGR